MVYKGGNCEFQCRHFEELPCCRSCLGSLAQTSMVHCGNLLCFPVSDGRSPGNEGQGAGNAGNWHNRSYWMSLSVCM